MRLRTFGIVGNPSERLRIIEYRVKEILE